MWLLRRKRAVLETSGEVLPPATGPMRRIEIRSSGTRLTRLVPSESIWPVEGEGPAPDSDLRLPRPPDG